MIKVKFVSSAIVASDLDVVEERFCFRFPKEFRDFYLKFNGGRPEKDRFVNETNRSVIDSFLPIKYSMPPLDTLETTIQCVKIEKRLLPDYLIPFGVDPFGNYYCFSRRESELGAIYLFYMDTARPEKAANFLASSLGSFLEKLHSKTDISGC